MIYSGNIFHNREAETMIFLMYILSDRLEWTNNDVIRLDMIFLIRKESTRQIIVISGFSITKGNIGTSPITMYMVICYLHNVIIILTSKYQKDCNGR